MTPSPQTHRPISFQLLQGSAPVGRAHELIIRPSELTRTEPQRVAVHNTLGGAYVDAFGRGVGAVTMAGTTGWRGGPDQDGAAKFAALREAIHQWDALRQDKLKAGLSPDETELSLVDTLDGFALVVAPQDFQLRRNRQSPLIMQFMIRLLVVRELAAPLTGGADSILRALNPFERVASSLDALLGVIGLQGGCAAALDRLGSGSVLGALAPAGRDFLRYSQGLLSTVQAGVQAGTELAAAVQLAGRNVFSAIAGVAGMPAAIVATLGGIVSAFTGAWCNLINGVAQLRNVFNLQPLFGASNCSSTGGGSPASAFAGTGVNPFAAILAASPVATSAPTATARQALATWAALDPLASPLTIDQAAALLRAGTP